MSSMRSGVAETGSVSSKNRNVPKRINLTQTHG